jgi:hypothetical protein
MSTARGKLCSTSRSPRSPDVGPARCPSSRPTRPAAAFLRLGRVPGPARSPCGASRSRHGFCRPGLFTSFGRDIRRRFAALETTRVRQAILPRRCPRTRSGTPGGSRSTWSARSRGAGTRSPGPRYERPRERRPRHSRRASSGSAPGDGSPSLGAASTSSSPRSIAVSWRLHRRGSSTISCGFCSRRSTLVFCRQQQSTAPAISSPRSSRSSRVGSCDASRWGAGASASSETGGCTGPPWRT